MCTKRDLENAIEGTDVDLGADDKGVDSTLYCPNGVQRSISEGLHIDPSQGERMFEKDIYKSLYKLVLCTLNNLYSNQVVFLEI